MALQATIRAVRAERELQEYRREAEQTLMKPARVLERQGRESVTEYIKRVGRELESRGYTFDQWYRIAADVWRMTDHSFYSIYMSPSLGEQLRV